MNLKQIPLALALALAIGALASGCTRDIPPAPATDVDSAGQVTPADTDAHADAHDAHDVSHAAGVDFPVPDNHVAWQPDAPLIEGMTRVRTAIAALEEAGPQPDEATVLARAADVDAAVEYMFENCSLPVEPDIALHAILARLMAGTQALQADPADVAPVHDLSGAVDNYEQLFDDPDAGAATAG